MQTPSFYHQDRHIDRHMHTCKLSSVFWHLSPGVCSCHSERVELDFTFWSLETHQVAKQPFLRDKEGTELRKSANKLNTASTGHAHSGQALHLEQQQRPFCKRHSIFLPFKQLHTLLLRDPELGGRKTCKVQTARVPSPLLGACPLFQSLRVAIGRVLLRHIELQKAPKEHTVEAWMPYSLRDALWACEIEERCSAFLWYLFDLQVTVLPWS